jgi:hypothetical protein
MTLKDRLPAVFPLFREDSELRVTVESFQAQIDEFRNDTTTVKRSLFVETATGQSLDLIGDDFGLVGRRRNRDDGEYRQFLQGLIPAFDGRGTEQDVEIAVAAGVAQNPSVVDLRQDFQNREYELEILGGNWIAHRSATTRNLAELADPVAVDRIDPVHLFVEDATPEPAVTSDTTTAETIARGLSSQSLKELSTDDFVLSVLDKPAANIQVVTGDVINSVNQVSANATPTISISLEQTTRTTDGLSSLALGELSTRDHTALSV